MPFCYNCGENLLEKAKFCPECGTPIGQKEAQEKAPQERSEDNEIRKCPGCSATIGSFSTHCPMCGNEIGGNSITNTVQDLVDRLERINAKEMPVSNSQCPSSKKAREKWEMEQRQARWTFEREIDEEKAELIINYPVPTTKAEILEFMLLASSNYDVKKGNADVVNRAWKLKLEQVYEKATIAMPHSADFEKVKKIYERVQSKIEDNRRKTRRLLWIFGVLALALVGLIVWFSTRPTSFETLEIKNVTMEIADYWTEGDSEKNCLSYYENDYGEDSSEVTFDVKFVAETDKKYDVTFDGLQADNKNMIKAIEKMYWDCNVLKDEVLESDHGVKGILYTFSLEQSTGWFSSESAKGYCFVFPSESDRYWFYVTMIVVNSASDDSYYKDYMKTLESISCK